MTATFPAVPAKKVVKVLEKLGFVFVRQAGSSHAIYKRLSDNRRTVVPMHAQIIVKRRTLKAILADAGITVATFQRLLQES